MRILHCIDTTEVAGTERHVAELATFQAQAHEVTVLIGHETCDALTGDDIAHRIGPSVRIQRAARGGYAFSLRRLTRRERFDVVHTHLGRASFRARFLVPRDLLLVATLHNRYVPRVYGGHDGLICIARWQRDLLPAGRHPRATVIGNWTVVQGAEPGRREAVRQAFGIAPDIRLIGAAGRFVPEKNFAQLLEAFAEARLPDTRLILFGAGPEEGRLRALAGPNVLFGGYRQDLPGDMAALDGFVLPSRCEPFGLVLLEAMAAGLPICATDAGGVPDLLEGEPECLVASGDRSALVAGLRALSRQPARQWNLDAWRLPGRAADIERFYAALRAGRGGAGCRVKTAS